MAKRKRGHSESKIHIEIGHFSEQHTFGKIKWRYYWHDSMEFVRRVIYECDHCQMVKEAWSIQYGIQEMKSINICDLFYK
jgi:hypothetical protein